MKKYVKDKIYDYLFKNRRRWVSKKELEDMRQTFGCMAETVGRKSRYLEETDVHIKKRPGIDGIIQYRYV